MAGFTADPEILEVLGMWHRQTAGESLVMAVLARNVHIVMELMGKVHITHLGVEGDLDGGCLRTAIDSHRRLGEEAPRQRQDG
jgi:hypothetical protein